MDIFLSVQTFQVLKTWKVYLRAKMSSSMAAGPFFTKVEIIAWWLTFTGFSYLCPVMFNSTIISSSILIRPGSHT